MNVIVEDLTKIFEFQKVVDSISFRAQKGEILGLLGPYGAGKSTTLRMLAGLLAPTQGTIRFDNYTYAKNSNKIKNLIGYLPEQTPLYDSMNVIDFLFFLARLHNIPRYKITSRVLDMISLCGLDHEKHKLIRELSKGHRQRLGIAQALIHDPEVLLLDEPTTGLDPNQSFGIREIIKTVGQDKTIVISSHILSEIENTCDRVMIISKGKIVANGTTAELRRDSSSGYSLRISIKGDDTPVIHEALCELPQVQDIQILHKQEFELRCAPESEIEKTIFELCKNNDWYITEMTPIQTRLEDVFRQVTQN